MNQVTKNNIKQVLFIAMGLTVVTGLGIWGFEQTGFLYGLSWTVFLILLFGSIFVFTGLLGLIVKGIKSLFKRDAV